MIIIRTLSSIAFRKTCRIVQVRHLGVLSKVKQLGTDGAPTSHGRLVVIPSRPVYKRLGGWYSGKGNERFYLNVFLIVTAAHFVALAAVKWYGYCEEEKRQANIQKEEELSGAVRL